MPLTERQILETLASLTNLKATTLPLKDLTRRLPSRRGILLAFALACLAISGSAVGQTGPPDATLYTNYFLDSTHTSIGWFVCGTTQETGGCYASGSLGPFGRIGALLEGNPSTNRTTNTVTRAIYVLDIAGGSTLNGVLLYVYTKTDIITPSSDAVSVTLSKTISLPLLGGGSALASMASNNKFLFIGTNHSQPVVELDKSTFKISQFGGFSSPIHVSAITTNKYGYVTVTFGSFDPSKVSGNIEFRPDGTAVGVGGGAWFMLNTSQAVLPSTLH